MFELLCALLKGNGGTDRHTSNFSTVSLTPEEVKSLISVGILRLLDNSISDSIDLVSVNEYLHDFDRLSFEPGSINIIHSATTQLKAQGRALANSQKSSWEIVDIWEGLAINETLSVLEFYCQKHGVCYCPGELTLAAIQRSLNRFGLAQTSRYVCNSVRRAKTVASETGASPRKAFNFIYGNLNFWLDDERARTYNAPPFLRMDGVLSEPILVTIFAHVFLEANGINYFRDPISISSMK